MKKVFAAAAFLFLLPLCAHAAESYPARVVSIADGDTITVLNRDKQQIKIRLYG